MAVEVRGRECAAALWVATGGKVISLQAGLLNLVFIIIEKRVLAFSYFRLFTNGIIQSNIIQ